jgi:hypothetical protein
MEHKVASLRQRWKVSWDDGDAVFVTSTVQDIINAVDRLPADSAGNRVAVNTALIHSALQRRGLCEMPYQDWVDVLDSYEEMAGSSNGTGPTQQAVLAPEQSVLPVSLAQTGAAG